MAGILKNALAKAKASTQKLFKKESQAYISSKESRRISKENARMISMYQRKKKRKIVDEQEYLTQMKDDNNILEFEDLRTYFFTDAGTVKAVDGVSFNIPRGSTVGIVGESGCGKSVTSLSLLQLVQEPQGQIVGGSIRFKTQDYVLDSAGNPQYIYQVEKDENGNTLLDESGKPVYKLEPELDANGKPIMLNNQPVMTKVPEIGQDGLPLFISEEKVYDIAKMPSNAMRKIRGKQISMIFQEPMTSLNPVFTIGYQLDEVVLLHIPNSTPALAAKRSKEVLNLVGIAMADKVYSSYPHELSGGMRQRVVIAMSLLCNPKLIIADEPTTALDVTIQAQILDLLRDLKNKINSSIMLITHDLGVISEMADYVVVMYAGKIIEIGTVREIFKNPKHPYTIGLQKSKPVVNQRSERLYSIPGQVPNPIDMPKHCYFRDRCTQCIKECSGQYPPMIEISSTHKVACYLYNSSTENLK